MHRVYRRIAGDLCQVASGRRNQMELRGSVWRDAVQERGKSTQTDSARKE